MRISLFIPPRSWARSISVFVVSLGLALVFLSVIALNLDPPVQAFSKQGREAGAVLFREKGCQHCHGVEGIGTDLGPDLSGIGKRWKKDHISEQIIHGGGGMPAFGEALQPDEVALLVEYLHAKRKAARHASPAPPLPPGKSATDDTGN